MYKNVMELSEKEVQSFIADYLWEFGRNLDITI